MGKQQPAIARLESGRVSPSIAFLEEVAEALDAKLIVRPRALTRDGGVLTTVLDKEKRREIAPLVLVYLKQRYSG